MSHGSSSSGSSGSSSDGSDRDVDESPPSSPPSSPSAPLSPVADADVPDVPDKGEDEDGAPALEWPTTDVKEDEAVVIADEIIQTVTRHIQSGEEGMPWEEIPGVDTSKVMPGIKQWGLDNYETTNACVSRKTREVIGKEHPDYRAHGISVCDTMWVAIAHLIHVEEDFRPLARKLAEASSAMFSKQDGFPVSAAASKDSEKSVRQRYLFSVATLTPVLLGVIREWNRMDRPPSELSKGSNHNRLTWNGERLNMLKITCAITAVSQGLFRQIKCDADGSELMRFNHLCARLFYWTDLEDALLAYRPTAEESFRLKLEETVARCKPQFYMWVRSQLQFDLERGREFGDVFRQTFYGFELGAGAVQEYKRMNPTKSDIMIRDTQPMALFMDTDTDLSGDPKVATARYDAHKKAFEAGLAEIAKRETHPMHQALMLSLVIYFFEQVHRRRFVGRYCFFHYHLPQMYKTREKFFTLNAFETPPRERRPRIMCTGAAVHVLFRRKWIPMSGLVSACIAFFVLCKRFHGNELETGVKISDRMFGLIPLESIAGLET